MNRYIRLGYVLPRLVALIALIAAAQVVSGWAVRWAVVDGGQRLVGAKVEVTKTAVSLLDARVTLQGVAVADPRDPMTNLMEADTIELDLDADALLRRAAVAEQGAVRGLRFGSPREESGALDDTSASDEFCAPAWAGQASAAAGRVLGPWIDGLGDGLSKGTADELESVRLAEELAQRWPQRYQTLRHSVEQLRYEALAIDEGLSEARKNPLRHADFLAEAPGRIDALLIRMSDLRADLASLPTEAAADRQRVDEAWRHDQQLVRQRLQIDQLNADSLTSALLGERVTAVVGMVVDGVRWTRVLAAPGDSPIVAPARRGADVRFEGAAVLPGLLVRSLELRGVAPLGGRPVEFSGVVTDWTTEPSLHGQPTRVELRTASSTPLEVWATLDRTGSKPVDRLRVVCPALPAPGGSIALGDGLEMAIAGSTADLVVDVSVSGERLRGELRAVQQRIGLTPRVAADAPTVTRRIGLELAERLDGVSGVETTVRLAGSLERPRFAVKSNVGTVLAAAFRESVETVAQDEAARLLAEGRRRIDARLEALDGVLAAANQGLSDELASQTELVDRIRSATRGSLPGRLPFGLGRLGGLSHPGQPATR